MRRLAVPITPVEHNQPGGRVTAIQPEPPSARDSDADYLRAKLDREGRRLRELFEASKDDLAAREEELAEREKALAAREATLDGRVEERTSATAGREADEAQQRVDELLRLREGLIASMRESLARFEAALSGLERQEPPRGGPPPKEPPR